MPKGWEEEYSMARLSEVGGSPRAREEVAERSFGRVAWDSNGRNSSSASSLTPSQRISLLRGRSEMFSEMYDALFESAENATNAAITTGNARQQQQQQQQHSRRLVQDFRNMVLEELYLSEAIYRSMLDVHEDESEGKFINTKSATSRKDMKITAKPKKRPMWGKRRRMEEKITRTEKK